MACLLQGTALPNIKTSTCTATTAPAFYNTYLQNLATCGAKAAQNAQYVGAQPLQTQAFQTAQANAGNYQPALTAATGAAQNVAGACVSKLAQNYMSPYTQDVVNAIGNLGQSNIAQNLAPGATAGLVGSGQFGSSRGTAALGNVLANAGLGITAQQACALQKGYTTALCTAQKQIQDQLAASQQLGNLATTTGALNTQCLNNLSTLGAQQQTIAQNAQLFPMQQLTSESALLKGFTVPTSTSSKYCGPIPGAYNTSPLAQIAGLGSLATGILGKCGISLSCNAALKKIVSGATGALSGGSGSGSSSTTGCSATQGTLTNGYTYSNGPNGLVVTTPDGQTLTGNAALDQIASGYQQAGSCCQGT
jgi:hypothetical protein